jgi:intracellular sulfur oxidation DsrE/DsrF family protein
MCLCYAATGFLYKAKKKPVWRLSRVLIRNLLILLLVAAVFWLFADRLVVDQPVVDSPARVPAELEPIVPPSSNGAVQQYVADISVHTIEELEVLFASIEQLLDRPRGADEAPFISVVLHGPEVDFFALQNYSRYKDIVDHAAKLSALGVVELNICLTQMRARGIEPDQVPAFLNQVPYGPGEVKRLVDEGYVVM